MAMLLSLLRRVCLCFKWSVQNTFPISGGGQQCVFLSEGAMAVVNRRDVGVWHKGRTLFLVFHTLIIINY